MTLSARTTRSVFSSRATARTLGFLALAYACGALVVACGGETADSTGQTGAGAAPQATGPQITAVFNQVYPNWILPCDIPGADNLRIQMDVTLDEQGRITAGPTLIGARSDPVWRAAADGAIRAIRQTAPFDVPSGFPGGRFRPTFVTERACRGR